MTCPNVFRRLLAHLEGTPLGRCEIHEDATTQARPPPKISRCVPIRPSTKKEEADGPLPGITRWRCRDGGRPLLGPPLVSPHLPPKCHHSQPAHFVQQLIPLDGHQAVLQAGI